MLASAFSRRARDLGDLVSLAVPLALVQLGGTSMGLIDTAIAGRQSGTTLAAVGLGSALFMLVAVIGMGTLMGLEPIIAQALGADRAADATAAMRQAAWAALIVGVPLCAVTLVVAGHLTAFGIGAELAHETRDYLVVRVWTLWLLLASVAFRAYLQAARRPLVIVASALVLVGVDAGADYVLLFGDAGLVRLGLPAVGLYPMGAVGVAFANALAHLVQVTLLAWVLRPQLFPPAGGDPFRPRRAAVGQILGVGLPLGFQLGAEVGVFALVGVLIARMGTVAIGAHQVALQLASVTWAVAMGLGAATAVQVARAIGRGDAAGTRRAGLLGIGLGVVWMAVMALILAVWPEVLAASMTDDPEVQERARELLLIAAVFQIVDGVQAVGGGALRGAGVTRWTFVANLVGHWAVGVPVGVLLGIVAGRGAGGLWWGLTAGLSAVAVAILVKFVRTSRHRIAPLGEGAYESPP
jgi:MATE family multidrug resistance protein